MPSTKGASKGTKRCTKCGDEKPISEFSRDKNRKDGFSYNCKVCKNATNREWIEKNPERARESFRKWKRNNPEKARQVNKDWRVNNPGRALELVRADRDAEPEKYQARAALNNAVRDGKIPKPLNCSECGAEVRLDGHHVDYAKPLDVEWLCRPCHSRHHADATI